MTLPIVLDSAGLSALCEPTPPPRLRALLTVARDRFGDVLVPAAICAEVCRGVARTRQVEALIARAETPRSSRRPLTVIPTDFELARQIGAVLHGAGVGSRFLADAHIVAVCAQYGGGLVLTSDPDDIHQLAAAVPAVRIVTRSVD